jgi:hypothetical protein
MYLIVFWHKAALFLNSRSAVAKTFAPKLSSRASTAPVTSREAAQDTLIHGDYDPTFQKAIGPHQPADEAARQGWICVGSGSYRGAEGRVLGWRPTPSVEHLRTRRSLATVGSRQEQKQPPCNRGRAGLKSSRDGLTMNRRRSQALVLREAPAGRHRGTSTFSLTSPHHRAPHRSGCWPIQRPAYDFAIEACAG